MRLIPEPPDPALVESLRSAGIIAVPYSPDNGHDAAWQLLAGLSRWSPAVPAVDFEAAQVRSHLAAAYARAKGREFRADRDRMLSALMIPLLSDYGSNAVVELQVFLTQAETRLALPRTFDSSHLMEALKLLERDGVIVVQGKIC